MTNNFLIFILLVILTSCSNDDNDVPFDPCIDLITPSEITITNPSVQAVDNDNLTGYVIKATITNNTSNMIFNGEARIYANINGIVTSFSSLVNCERLEPNTSCDLLLSFSENREELDLNVTVRCTHYDIN